MWAEAADFPSRCLTVSLYWVGVAGVAVHLLKEPVLAVEGVSAAAEVLVREAAIATRY